MGRSEFIGQQVILMWSTWSPEFGKLINHNDSPSKIYILLNIHLILWLVYGVIARVKIHEH